MTLTLVAKRGPAKTEVDSFPVMVSQNGREADCEVAPEGSYHCLVTEVGDHLEVHDLGSRNGTFVNGVRVTKAKLRSGDTLSLNGTEFVVNGRPRPQRYMRGVRN